MKCIKNYNKNKRVNDSLVPIRKDKLREWLGLLMCEGVNSKALVREEIRQILGKIKKEKENDYKRS